MQWKISFSTSGDRLERLLICGNSYFEYSDGNKGELNIFVHDVTVSGEVYLARVSSNSSDKYSYKYKEYSLQKIDTDTTVYVEKNDRVDYVLAQDGRPYTGSITLTGEALDQEYITYDISAYNYTRFSAGLQAKKEGEPRLLLLSAPLPYPRCQDCHVIARRPLFTGEV